MNWPIIFFGSVVESGVKYLLCEDVSGDSDNK